jgi:hypothetical protein
MVEETIVKSVDLEFKDSKYSLAQFELAATSHHALILRLLLE